VSLGSLVMDLGRAALPPALRRRAAWLLAGWVALALVGISPVSPVAMDRADAALARGRPDLAAARYDTVSRHALSEQIRHEALRRSAVVWSGELARPAQARVRVERLVSEVDEPAQRAGLLAWSAELLVAERHPSEAAARYVAAADALPGTRAAGERLMRAALAYHEAGRSQAAAALWRRVVSEHPAQRAPALVGLAGQALRAGMATEALGLYERAARTTHDPHLAAAARLGAATCLERLGDLDSAIAELDQIDLPAPVRVQRVQGLKTRQSAGAL